MLTDPRVILGKKKGTEVGYELGFFKHRPSTSAYESYGSQRLFSECGFCFEQPELQTEFLGEGFLERELSWCVDRKCNRHFLQSDFFH